jgi:integrase
MAQDAHFILDDRVQLCRREESPFWQCLTYIEGNRYRQSTEEADLSKAQLFAEEWYIDLRAKAKAGTLPQMGPKHTFREAAELFMREYTALTQGQRSPRWVQEHARHLRVHLIPFFGDKQVADIDDGMAQEYRVHRMTPSEEKNPHARDNRPHKKGKLPARNTIHNEIVTLRMVLRTVKNQGWIKAVPEFAEVYKASRKVSPRPWFSPAEYKQLYTATREHAKTAAPQHKWDAEQLHDYVLFMANSGLRPDEAKNLRHRDVEIVKDGATGDILLEMEVDGKRGFGYCKTMPGAVKPYLRLLNRPKPPQLDECGEIVPSEPQLPKPEDKVFPSNHIKMFNALLKRIGLKFDRHGKARTSYSLRHTYISMRLSERAEIYNLAKNCRTSVEMIQKYYASHIKDTIDTGVINVRKPKTKQNVRLDPYTLKI